MRISWETVVLAPRCAHEQLPFTLFQKRRVWWARMWATVARFQIGYQPRQAASCFLTRQKLYGIHHDVSIGIAIEHPYLGVTVESVFTEGHEAILIRWSSLVDTSLGLPASMINQDWYLRCTIGMSRIGQSDLVAPRSKNRAKPYATFTLVLVIVVNVATTDKSSNSLAR